MSRAKKKAKKATRAPRTIMLAGMECPLKNGTLEWQGHVLNPLQVGQFKEEVDKRLEIANRPNSTVRYPGAYAREFAFSDLLWLYRPSVRAREEIASNTRMLASAAVTAGTLDKFHFHDHGPARDQGAELLRQLADDCGRYVKRLQHLAESVRLEESTHLQDWTARWSAYDAI